MGIHRDKEGKPVWNMKQFVIDGQIVNAETALHAAEAYVQHTYCGISDKNPDDRESPPDMVEVREVGQPITIMMTYEMKCTAEFKNEAVVGKWDPPFKGGLKKSLEGLANSTSFAKETTAGRAAEPYEDGMSACPEDEGRSWPPYGKSTGPKKPPMKPDPIPAGLKPTLSDD